MIQINQSAVSENTESRTWQESLKLFLHPRVVTMLFLGFSAGVPILLIFSSLGLWLREAGVERSAVTFFSWAALGYSFKFVWAPLVDQLPLPVLTRVLGRRRSWLLLSQAFVILAILWMATTDPAAGHQSLTIMALAAVLLGFSSATQDVVIDAYRIESAAGELQAMLSSTYIAGYRIGMLVAGAGALFLASHFGSESGNYSYDAWLKTYAVMAAVMLIGVATTLLIPEPEKPSGNALKRSTWDYLRFLLLFLLCVIAFIGFYSLTSGVAASAKSALTEWLGNRHFSGFLVALLRLGGSVLVAAAIATGGIRLGLVRQSMVYTAYVEPVLDYFRRYGFKIAWLLLALVACYRISDIVLGVIANIFYQDLGFTKAEIATVSKTYGLFMTIAGGFLGGLLSIRFGVIRVLFLGALLSSLTNLLFLWLSSYGHSVPMLYLVISADNLSAGLANAAFVAFLSSLTNISFTAVQYAIFSSLMTLFPKILGGYSGSMVDNLGYPSFFIITTVIGLPVLWLVYIAGKHLETRNA